MWDGVTEAIRIELGFYGPLQAAFTGPNEIFISSSL